MFNRKPYRIKRSGHSVFVKWLKPIELWAPEANDAYLPSLRKHVQASVDESAWPLVGRENPSSNPAYREYVERVRAQLIEEYSLQATQDEIKIGTYHMGLLVLSWPSDNLDVYPYYYRGIQLKPFKKRENAEQQFRHVP
jgi:hypothetical protein